MEYINNLVNNIRESNICFSIKNKYTANYIDVAIDKKIYFSIEFFHDIEAGGISLRNDDKVKFHDEEEILDFIEEKQESIELFPLIFFKKERKNMVFVYEKNDFSIEYYFEFGQKEKNELLNLIKNLKVNEVSAMD